MNAEMTILFEQTVHLNEDHRVEVILKEWTAGSLRQYIDLVLTLKVWNGQNVEFGDAETFTSVLDTSLRHEAIRQAIKGFDDAVALVSYVETRTPEQIAFDDAAALVDRAYDAFERAKADSGVTENTQRQGDYWKDTHPMIYAAWITYQDAVDLRNAAGSRMNRADKEATDASR